MVGSGEPYFLLHHVDGWVLVLRLPGEHVAPGCTMESRQASGVSMMFSWETLGPAIHVDVTLTHDRPWEDLSLEWYSLMAVASFSRIMRCATKLKWFRNGLSTITSLKSLKADLWGHTTAGSVTAFLSGFVVYSSSVFVPFSWCNLSLDMSGCDAPADILITLFFFFFFFTNPQP